MSRIAFLVGSALLAIAALVGGANVTDHPDNKSQTTRLSAQSETTFDFGWGP
jgi:hypothetical protein